jgi:DinB superfamily
MLYASHSRPEEAMTPEHLALVARIRSSAAALARAVASVPPAKLATRPRESEWSVQETLSHLRNVVLHVQGLRIRRLLYEADPVFADYDESAGRQDDLARAESAAAMVEMTVAEQEQIARILAALPDDRWRRQGRHPELGPMSIELLARRIGEHTEEHTRQIVETARAV